MRVPKPIGNTKQIVYQKPLTINLQPHMQCYSLRNCIVQYAPAMQCYVFAVETNIQNLKLKIDVVCF